uniref:Uncharacterized protein n=1 Tax=Rhizophora mucronata TaxID=61149 RepID=A0A2P2LKE7_RHIMU
MVLSSYAVEQCLQIFVCRTILEMRSFVVFMSPQIICTSVIFSSLILMMSLDPICQSEKELKSLYREGCQCPGSCQRWIRVCYWTEVQPTGAEIEDNSGRSPNFMTSIASRLNHLNGHTIRFEWMGLDGAGFEV